MVILYYWTGASPSALGWSGGIAVVVGCIILGYTPKSAMDENVDNTHVVANIWIPLAVLAAIGWALCFSMGSYIGGADLPGFDVNKQFILMLIGNAIIMVPFALIAGRKTDTHSFNGIKLAVIPMALFAFGDICIPQAFEAEGADQYGGLIGAISGAYPMVTLAFAFVVLKEKIIALHWGAIAFVISGIMLCTGAVEIVWNFM
ncbi:MAG: hypothetical protein IH948_01970, partial [Bacteroidetes bacterium]|nr:hypothetical protein [Bacteroidota bacterium]